MKAFILCVALSGCSACGGITTTHGVPNLVQVEPGVWRSGQPTTAEGWSYLYGLGIRHVVKLNFDSEGSDQGAVVVGMDVLHLGIQPNGDLVSIVEPPDPANIAAAVNAVRNKDGWLLHCTHGQDRTGVVVGVYRIIVDGWTKDQAWSEMLQRGYHVEMIGLDEYWNSFDPKKL